MTYKLGLKKVLGLIKQTGPMYHQIRLWQGAFATVVTHSVKKCMRIIYL